MTRRLVWLAAAVLGATVTACGSGRHSPASPAPTSDRLVVHVVTVRQPSTSTSPVPGVRVTARDRQRPAVVATTDPSGSATFHLPKGTYTVSAGCGGARVVTARGRVVLPMRAQCPPP
jgi:hypothetical protein